MGAGRTASKAPPGRPRVTTAEGIPVSFVKRGRGRRAGGYPPLQKQDDSSRIGLALDMGQLSGSRESAPARPRGCARWYASRRPAQQPGGGPPDQKVGSAPSVQAGPPAWGRRGPLTYKPGPAGMDWYAGQMPDSFGLVLETSGPVSTGRCGNSRQPQAGGRRGRA